MAEFAPVRIKMDLEKKFEKQKIIFVLAKINA